MGFADCYQAERRGRAPRFPIGRPAQVAWRAGRASGAGPTFGQSPKARRHTARSGQDSIAAGWERRERRRVFTVGWPAVGRVAAGRAGGAGAARQLKNPLR